MMKTIRQIIQQWYPNLRQALIAGIIGLSISLSFYLGLLQRHYFSWTYLAYALLIAAAGFLLAGWLNQRLFGAFSRIPRRQRAISRLLSLLS